MSETADTKEQLVVPIPKSVQAFMDETLNPAIHEYYQELPAEYHETNENGDHVFTCTLTAHSYADGHQQILQGIKRVFFGVVLRNKGKYKLHYTVIHEHRKDDTYYTYTADNAYNFNPDYDFDLLEVIVTMSFPNERIPKIPETKQRPRLLSTLLDKILKR